LGFRSELERKDEEAKQSSIQSAGEANRKRIESANLIENLRYDRETAATRLKQGRTDLLETRSEQGSEAVFRALAGGDPERASRLQVENEVKLANLKAFETPGTSKELFEATRAAGQARLDADARERVDQRREKYNAIDARGRIAEVRGEDSVDVQRLENQAATAALRGSPLAASLATNSAKRLDALNKIDRFQNSDLYNETNRRFDILEAQLKKDDTHEHSRALNAAAARGRVLDIELQGGYYAREAASSAAIKEAALLKVNDLIYEGAAGNKNLIAKTFQNAEKEENIVAKNFLLRFKPEEFNINRTASQSLNNDEATETLKSIDENIKAIKEASQNWGKAQ